MANVFANEAVLYFTAQIEDLLARAANVAKAATISSDQVLMQNATFHDVEAVAIDASTRLNAGSCAHRKSRAIGGEAAHSLIHIPAG